MSRSLIPLDAAHFEDEYLSDTLCDLEMIESYCRNLSSVYEPVSTKEVSDAIRKLNSSKAADEIWACQLDISNTAHPS